MVVIGHGDDSDEECGRAMRSLPAVDDDIAQSAKGGTRRKYYVMG